MKTTSVVCDKCGAAVIEDGSILTVEAGALRRKLGPRTWDICRDCSGALLDWFATGRPELSSLDVADPLNPVYPHTVEA